MAICVGSPRGASGSRLLLGSLVVRIGRAGEMPWRELPFLDAGGLLEIGVHAPPSGEDCRAVFGPEQVMELRAFGFSPSGRLLVIATPDGVRACAR